MRLFVSRQEEMKALRARLDAMQEKLASAKKDIADGKDQRAKIRDKKMQGIQDQTKALKKNRDDIVKASADMSADACPNPPDK